MVGRKGNAFPGAYESHPDTEETKAEYQLWITSGKWNILLLGVRLNAFKEKNNVFILRQRCTRFRA